jgi:hypothetical protein
MADVWQTIEEAAVTLGLSVRTVNRHITAGKLQSRLYEGRREVLIDGSDPAVFRSPGTKSPPSEPPVNGSPNFTFRPREPSISTVAEIGSRTSDSRFQDPTPDATKEGHSRGSGTRADVDAVSDSESQPFDSHRQRVNPEVASNRPWDVQTMLALTDRFDDNATMAVAAYQTLATSAENQVQSLRRVAFGAWGVVGVMAAGITIGVGWAAVAITSAEKTAQHLQRQLDESSAKTREMEGAAKDHLATRDELALTRGELKGELRARQPIEEENRRLQALLANRPLIGPSSAAMTSPPVPAVGSASPVSPTTQPGQDVREVGGGLSTRPATVPVVRPAGYPVTPPPFTPNSNPTFGTR